MALQTSVSICGAQLAFTYNAGNGRASSVEMTSPIRTQWIVVLTDGTVIDQTVDPGVYSWPLPANRVRITFAPDGEVTMTEIERIAAGTLF
jgi:hypothetical protein